MMGHCYIFSSEPKCMVSHHSYRLMLKRYLGCMFVHTSTYLVICLDALTCKHSICKLAPNDCVLYWLLAIVKVPHYILHNICYRRANCSFQMAYVTPVIMQMSSATPAIMQIPYVTPALIGYLLMHYQK